MAVQYLRDDLLDELFDSSFSKHGSDDTLPHPARLHLRQVPIIWALAPLPHVTSVTASEPEGVFLNFLQTPVPVLRQTKQWQCGC